MTNSSSPHWTDAQVKMFAASTLKRVGGPAAWAMLVPCLRVAVADQTVLGVLRQQVRDIPVEAIDDLQARVLRALNLEDV